MTRPTYKHETTYEQLLAGELRRSQDICITYTVSFGRPAKLYGPPENCHEAEPDELEIETIELIGEGVKLIAFDLERLKLWAAVYMYDDLVEHARECEADAEEAAREHAAETRAELARERAEQ